MRGIPRNSKRGMPALCENVKPSEDEKSQDLEVV